MAERPTDTIRRQWRRVVHSRAWTRPSHSELAVVAKAGLAAGLAWWLARVATDVSDPILAPLTAIVSVRVSVRQSVRTAVQRTVAVVLGVFVAIGVGDALDLNGFTIGVLVAVSLGIGEFVLHLPRQAATQVPISVLVVLTAVVPNQEDYGWRRAIETLIGAAVGVVVSVAMPGSRRRDARESLTRLAYVVESTLLAMGDGLQRQWSADETVDWRSRAHNARERYAQEAEDAVGDGRQAARWNRRDRPHIDELGRYEDALPHFQRVAIGVSVIARGLDDHAHDSDVACSALPEVGTLLLQVAAAVDAVLNAVLDPDAVDATRDAIGAVETARAQCDEEARRRVQHDDGEWQPYVALLVQVDRITGDLRACVSSD